MILTISQGICCLKALENRKYEEYMQEYRAREDEASSSDVQ